MDSKSEITSDFKQEKGNIKHKKQNKLFIHLFKRTQPVNERINNFINSAEISKSDEQHNNYTSILRESKEQKRIDDFFVLRTLKKKGEQSFINTHQIKQKLHHLYMNIFYINGHPEDQKPHHHSASNTHQTPTESNDGKWILIYTVQVLSRQVSAMDNIQNKEVLKWKVVRKRRKVKAPKQLDYSSHSATQ